MKTLVALLTLVALIATPFAFVAPARSEADPATFFSLDPPAVQAALDVSGSVVLPWSDGSIRVDLHAVQIFGPAYEAIGPHGPVPTLVRNYAGIVHGEPNSHVRLSLTSDWVMAIFILSDGDIKWLEPVDGQEPLHRLSDGFDFHHQVEDLEGPASPATGGSPAGAIVESHNCPLGLSQLYNTPVCPHHNEGPSVPGAPDGPTTRTVGETGTYCATSTDPDGDNIQYVFKWGDNTQSTTGYYSSGSTGCADHSWGSASSYCVSVYAQDTISPIKGESGCTWVSVANVANQAPFVPGTPSGPSSVTVNVGNSYCATATDPDGDNVQYIFDWGDGSQGSSSWVGSGQQGCANKAWSSTGSYCVKAYSQDGINAVRGWSGCRTVSVSGVSNGAPGTPGTPTGPTSVTAGGSGTYCSSATDPEGDPVLLNFDFGDGASGASGWVNSGASTCAPSHTWSTAGSYCVRAQSRDSAHGFGSYGNCLTVTVSNPVNQGPSTPGTPSGNNPVTVGTSNSYCSSATDPESNQVMLNFDFGDSSSGASGWVNSGASACSPNHSWSSTGTYCVRAQSKDSGHGYGSYGGCLNVQVNAANRAPTASAPWGPAYAYGGHDVPFAASISDPDGDGVRFVFQWGDGTTTNGQWTFPGDRPFANEFHAYPLPSSSATYTPCGYAEDAFGAKSATVCAASSIRIDRTRVKAEYIAMADEGYTSRYSDWNSRIAGYVNLVNGMYTQASPDVELVVNLIVGIIGWNDPDGTTCSDSLAKVQGMERTTSQSVELVQAFVWHSFQSSGNLGCGYQDGYASSALGKSIVSVKSADSWPSGVAETSGHEIGHGFHGQHRDATTWWEGGSAQHQACSIMYSADPNDPSSGYCYHQHLEANQAEKDSFRAGATGSQGRNQDPRLPSVINLGSSGRTLSLNVRSWDPDQDRVQYHVDWGDGAVSDSAWVTTGTGVGMSHQYASTGTKTVSFTITDAFNRASFESKTYTVTA